MTTIEEAAAVLRDGGLVVIPTDTVYGVACSPLSEAAVAAIFALKGRPTEKPLPVLGDGPDALAAVARFDEPAVGMARAYWPGPLTLVLPRAEGFTHDLGGTDNATIAVRVPRHPVALELLAGTGPLAVTSANRSGAPPATTVEEAQSALGDGVGAYLDGGRCDGEPSTVLSLVGAPSILRDGPLQATELMARLTR